MLFPLGLVLPNVSKKTTSVVWPKETVRQAMPKKEIRASGLNFGNNFMVISEESQSGLCPHVSAAQDDKK